MKTSTDEKCCEHTNKTGEIRMGREVKSKNPACTDSEIKADVANKKEEARENRASSLV